MAYFILERAKVASWYEWMGSFVMVQRKFRMAFNRDPPSHYSISKWHRLLMETGSVQDSKRNHSCSAHSGKNWARVTEYFTENPHSSTHCAANALLMSPTTIQRILKHLKWHPYKVHIVQKITEEDKENGLEFAQDEID
uniref:DUF4817 domain-containing protein n=1 Tax=Romanomermis culicivorax TaxID=13658 RepID=A0A915IFW3_ROMCU